MSSNYSLNLTPREDLGSAASRRFRREGLVPVVVYGADKDNAYYTVEHDSLMHSLEIEAFHSAIIDVNEAAKNQSTILREVQMHSYKHQVLHIDLQRVKATEMISLRVPLHFIGDDTAPGIKTEGGVFSRLIVDVEIQCLPKNLPEFLEVDVSELGLNQSVHISDIVLPEGVELTVAYQDSDDFAIASITPPRISSADEEEIDELEGLGAAEGDEPHEAEAESFE